MNISTNVNNAMIPNASCDQLGSTKYQPHSCGASVRSTSFCLMLGPGWISTVTQPVGPLLDILVQIAPADFSGIVQDWISEIIG